MYWKKENYSIRQRTCFHTLGGVSMFRTITSAANAVYWIGNRKVNKDDDIRRYINVISGKIKNHGKHYEIFDGTETKQ